jgi:hypothetical protein
VQKFGKLWNPADAARPGHTFRILVYICRWHFLFWGVGG